MFEKKMQQEVINVQVDENGTLPTRNNPQDAGLDLYASEDSFIPCGENKVVHTNIKVELPIDTVGLICDRSSMGVKGLKVMGGVVDNTYRGEVKVVLHNLASKDYRHPGLEKYGYKINKGDKIAQMLVIPIKLPTPMPLQKLTTTSRGDKGFGSSGN